MRKRRKTRGSTLIEIITATSISMLVLLVGCATFVLGMETWFRGQARLDANEASQQAVREISMELREAMSVTVDAGGQGLSFRRPLKDGNGSYVQPITWDGVARRLQLDGSNNLQVTASDGTAARTLCKNVIFTDPLSAGGTGAYQIFTPGAGAITRSLTVMVVTRRGLYRQETVTSRSRETIFLRNIPQLTQ